MKEALIDTANPSPRELTEISDNLLNSESRKRILQAGANTVGYFISLLAGIVIMLIAVFFFLVDVDMSYSNGRSDNLPTSKLLQALAPRR